jgi:hypothetical protein
MDNLLRGNPLGIKVKKVLTENLILYLLRVNTIQEKPISPGAEEFK